MRRHSRFDTRRVRSLIVHATTPTTLPRTLVRILRLRLSLDRLAMLIRVILLAVALCLVEAQRPPYAGSSNRYPVVIPRFREEQQNNTPAASPSSSAAVDSRLGAGNAPGLANAPLPLFTMTTVATSSTIPPDLPVDARGDIDLINRIKTWPREKQPFWYINWKQIQEHRGDNQQQQQQQMQQSARAQRLR